MRAIRTITRMELHILVLLVTTMLAMAGWFETKLWNGRIINIILDQMENIFPIPGVIIEEATQPQMVHLYAANGNRLTESSTILAGEASFNHIIYMFLLMRRVSTQRKVNIYYKITTRRVGC